MTRSLNVLLGVSGGIAAIKAPELVRRLQERGHSVRCMLTRSAVAFVAPLPLEVLTRSPVYQEEYLAANHSGEELHLSAARWADVLCVAPATCNVLARLALGIADDFLTTTALVFQGPLVLAPAMSSEMWGKKIVQQHVVALEGRGARRVGPVLGMLASGEVGIGRLAEPLEIVSVVEASVGARDLEGRTVLVTAGPTREPIDAVRFLSNRSSGKMGFCVAAEAANRGARTLLVAGPVSLETPPGVERIDVETALEMEQATRELAPGSDLIVMTAAVVDFRPDRIAGGKLKKQRGAPEIDLVANPDILTGLAEVAPAAVRVGFAAETGSLESEATRKLETKRVDFIVANDVARSEIGFGSDDNEVTVFAREGEPIRIPRQAKRMVAARLLDLFSEALTKREAGFVPSGR